MRATLWRGEGFGVVALEEVAVVPVVHVAATAVFYLQLDKSKFPVEIQIKVENIFSLFNNLF